MQTSFFPPGDTASAIRRRACAESDAGADDGDHHRSDRLGASGCASTGGNMFVSGASSHRAFGLQQTCRISGLRSVKAMMPGPLVEDA